MSKLKSLGKTNPLATLDNSKEMNLVQHKSNFELLYYKLIK